MIRYGGDEFVIMGIAKSEKDVEAYWEHVNAEIEKYNTHHYQTLNKQQLIVQEKHH